MICAGDERELETRTSNDDHFQLVTVLSAWMSQRHSVLWLGLEVGVGHAGRDRSKAQAGAVHCIQYTLNNKTLFPALALY